MTELLLVKELVKNYIGKYEVYLKPLGKFLLALVTLLCVNKTTGYMSKIDNSAIVLILALMCSFMPMNFIVVVAGLFVVLHFYALSMECALVALVLFLILALLYFRFAPKDTIVLAILPICFALKLPYAVPVCMGLIGGPASAVSVACGVVVYYVIHYVTQNSQAISVLDAQDMSARFRYVVDGLLNNKAMLVVMMAFAITVIVVYVIRRLPFDHCWTAAIVGGVMVQMLLLLIGSLKYDTDISVVGIIIGSILAAAIGKGAEFLLFHLDYSRTEKVQFEDDEYYYYVKAVPKITVSKPEKTVKKINSRKKKKRSPSRENG